MTFSDQEFTARVMENAAELGIRRAADELGANVAAILDSREARAAVGAIDMGSVTDYNAAVTAAVKPIVEASPQRFGVAVPATQEVSREPAQWTREEAVAVAKSDPQALQKAMNDGLLTDIGYPPPRKRGQG